MKYNNIIEEKIWIRMILSFNSVNWNNKVIDKLYIKNIKIKLPVLRPWPIPILFKPLNISNLLLTLWKPTLSLFNHWMPLRRNNILKRRLKLSRIFCITVRNRRKLKGKLNFLKRKKSPRKKTLFFNSNSQKITRFPLSLQQENCTDNLIEGGISLPINNNLHKNC